jgi:hypothetical protein
VSGIDYILLFVDVSEFAQRMTYLIALSVESKNDRSRTGIHALWCEVIF